MVKKNVSKLCKTILILLASTTLTKASTYPLKAPKNYSWSFSGIFGTYDKAQLQRGLQIYKEVCANCHSLHYVAFNNLQALGYSKQQIALLASRYKLPQNAYFPDPFPNEANARAANNGALPPDLSNIVKLRKKAIFSYSGGANYVASLLSGYEATNAGFVNPYYYKGLTIAMPPPLADDIINYADGTPQTTEQYAQDVAAFLYWCANPHIIERKQIGFCVISFLLVLCLLLYILKQEFFNQLYRHTTNKGKINERN